MKKIEQFIQTIGKHVEKERIIREPMMLLAYAIDASCYRLVPQLIVQVSISEMQNILKNANKNDISVTFRAAGTSFCGQAITDSVLLTLTENWRNYKILKNNNEIYLQPGLRGGEVNALLKPYKKKIGPDPASIDSAKIGGIAANNSSGMCCGTEFNSYNTLESMTLVLSDGTILNTANEASY